MKKNALLLPIFLSSLFGAVLGGAVIFFSISSTTPSQNDLIRDFYLTENAVHVSPHTLRKKMDKGEKDFILVDLRSSQEYEKSHIIGAINIPAYIDPNTSVSLDKDKEQKERIIKEFNKLASAEKDIIVYCYSIPCMTGRKIGKLLAENGLYVKHLGIGWNEWRYFWNLWNHDGETPTKFEDYIIGGRDPGVPKISENPSPCAEGELGC